MEKKGVINPIQVSLEEGEVDTIIQAAQPEIPGPLGDNSHCTTIHKQTPCCSRQGWRGGWGDADWNLLQLKENVNYPCFKWYTYF